MLKLLGRKNSSNVQKVLWMCEEIALPFEREDYGMEFGKTRDAEYLSMNPNGLVPTIIDDGFVLWESNAILRYLGARHGAGKVWPDDARARALADQWMDWQQTVLGPAYGPIFFQLVRTKPDQRDMKVVPPAVEKTATAFGMLDAWLAKNDFVAGKAFSIGDIPVGIVAYRWFNFEGIQRPALKYVKRWYDRLTERPAFKKTIMVGMR